jgi:DNA-binding Lrp family transcriptional regulator
MDRTDRRILSELSRDGRVSLTDLAQRVGLTPSPCHRRLRDLERTGVIRGYAADVDPAALGLGFEALVFASLRRMDADSVAAFEAGVESLGNVVSAERLFGDPDYLLRVLTTDLAAYQRLFDERLATLPSVDRLSSTIVMKRLTTSSPADVPGAGGGRS